ncbi:nuclear transport factor 2 family protein [Pseudomonas sp. Au-Pse12]|jgi:hypothetical protein|uniref:nuclear transport factor 2 family protein n=1 Tax=Pseudomonas sp. Au-Pse12 TaxID=2906459 RepID=UPI001E3934F9|nr:nuclear transport factor 2 family protein [Pseudomonas sp. Au-Pse12]MCE4052710.1 nuclear transport factor 2 family protein [Pseudomonas sp. Au-Pse12]
MSATDPSLAPAIVAYVTAVNSGDSTVVASIFAARAQVFDEREHCVGPQQIARWMGAGARRLEVLGVQQRTGKILLDSRVCGDFPGSPQALRHTFRLDDQGRIERLDISR